MDKCDECKENPAEVMTAISTLAPAFVCKSCNNNLTNKRQEKTISELKNQLNDLPWKEARDIVGDWIDTEYYAKWLDENKELARALKPFADKAKKVIDVGIKPPADMQNAYDVLMKFGLLNKNE